ncbi:hypothetical protein ACNFIA_31090 [Pseudomonas sp. NY15437]|uniref:hypothetical protein n=1 Tax=Pseudomonas sp. NY15437 TaxID=3400360 RepID=UPI003A87BB15
MSNLWKNCWEAPVRLMARGFAEAGRFLINQDFQPLAWLCTESGRFSVHDLSTAIPGLC